METEFHHVNVFFYEKLQEVIIQNLHNNDLYADTVAKALLISKSTLNRKLKVLGKPSINEFIKEIRLQKSIDILSSGVKVSEVSARVGFKSPSYFTHCFKAHYHRTPARFIKAV